MLYFRKIILCLLLLMLYACGSAEKDTAQNNSTSKATAALPVGLQKLTLAGGGTLSAYITIDGDTANRSLMNINPAGEGSASLAIPGLSLAPHSVSITYEYTLGGETYVLATSNKNIDLSAGSDSLSFIATDYEIDRYDNDGDGTSNAAELKAGTDPGVGAGGTPHLVFTSATTVSVPENTTNTAYQAVARAVDDAPVSFALSGGLDQDFFSINASNGILRFINAADFETPLDSDQNNTYIVQITAIDGAVQLAQTLVVTVTNVNETGSAEPFITIWQTDNPGTTGDNQVKIGTTGSGYNYTVNWGDNQLDNNVAGDITHTYAVPGTYTISISGTFPRLFFDRTGYDNEKLLSIEQWGDIQWQSMSRAFFLCANLQGNAADVPDLSQVTDMNSMFHGAVLFNQNINSWNVSNVMSMVETFSGTSAFNQDLSGWDVSSVITMRFMFASASAFNQNISSWNVAAVKDMNNMFTGASAFNQDIGIWKVFSVTNMQRMFFRATAFNADLSGWSVSSVTNMAGMFREAGVFNQNISNWDVSTVTGMGGMFRQASAFNQDISQWNVGAVTDMNNMFRQASAFNQNISGWTVSRVTDMNNMFREASVFNQNIGGWDVSLVTNMNSMFDQARAFDQDLGVWDVSLVGSMASMFNAIALSTVNYDALLNGWSGRILQNAVVFDAGTSQYSAGLLGSRDILTMAFNWVVTDGGAATLQ